MIFRKLKNGRTCEIMEIHWGDEARETEIVHAYYCDVEGEGPDAEVSEADLRELTELHFSDLMREHAERRQAAAERAWDEREGK